MGSVFSLSESVVPDSTVLEQASSEITANFVASLAGEQECLADLTAGLGINTFIFSHKADRVYAVEINPLRSKALEHNIKVAGKNNVVVVNDSCQNWLSSTDIKFDVVFADPSRRVKDGKRSVRLADCEPYVGDIIELLRGRCRRFLVKASPLLDIEASFHEFPDLENIYIIEVKGEVKELILDIKFDAEDIDRKKIQTVKCIRLKSDNSYQEFSFERKEKLENHRIDYIQEKKELQTGGYIYDPSPALRKAGMYGTLSDSFEGIKKFSPNTHLFYSDTLFPSYPGRIFKLKRIITNSELKKAKNKAFGVISRNHPASAEDISKKFHFSGEEEGFIIFATIGKEKIMIQADKM